MTDVGTVDAFQDTEGESDLFRTYVQYGSKDIGHYEKNVFDGQTSYVFVWGTDIGVEEFLSLAEEYEELGEEPYVEVLRFSEPLETPEQYPGETGDSVEPERLVPERRRRGTLEEVRQDPRFPDKAENVVFNESGQPMRDGAHVNGEPVYFTHWIADPTEWDSPAEVYVGGPASMSWESVEYWAEKTLTHEVPEPEIRDLVDMMMEDLEAHEW